MKSQPAQTVSKVLNIEFKQNMETPGSKEGRVVAEILKNYFPGDTAQLKIFSKILEAKITTKLFANETILLEKKEDKNIQWAILQRKVQIPLQKSDSLDLISYLKNSRLHRDLPENSVHETLDHIFNNQEKQDVSEEKVFKLLNQLFSFFPWSKDVEMFHWDWEKANAEGYFVSEEFNKIFLLEYNSTSFNKARFLFSFAKDGKNWNLHSHFESSEFYEIFLDKIQILRNYFIDEGILPKSIIVEYCSKRYQKESRGWIA